MDYQKKIDDGTLPAGDARKASSLAAKFSTLQGTFRLYAKSPTWWATRPKSLPSARTDAGRTSESVHLCSAEVARSCFLRRLLNGEAAQRLRALKSGRARPSNPFAHRIITNY